MAFAHETTAGDMGIAQHHVPASMFSGLVSQGVPASAAAPISHLPPIGVLFASFLGYNPMQQLLGPLLSHLPASNAAYVAGREFFPHLISAPFHTGLGVAFGFAIAANVIAAVASALTGRRSPAPAAGEPLGYELAAVSGEGGFEPTELVVPDVPEESADSFGQSRMLQPETETAGDLLSGAADTQDEAESLRPDKLSGRAAGFRTAVMTARWPVPCPPVASPASAIRVNRKWLLVPAV